MSWTEIALAVAGIPTLAAFLYLFASALLSRRQTPPTPASLRTRFDIVVPAHDEEDQITGTVKSLLAIDYPRVFFRVLVIADNCGDRTAERAADAGARVIVRNHPELRGKGYALALAFEHSIADDFADAVVVVDADTVVTSNLLSAFAARFETGAAAVQADYGVSNPMSSWRTRMMAIALAAFHGVRSLARERLRLSCGLRGNGMGFSKAVLRTQPHTAFSVVEDLEYGIQLGFAGYRVEYVHEARVLGQMVSTERASRSQRRRWEGGRRTLVRQYGITLLKQAWIKHSVLLLDLALDLLIPPVGELAALVAVGLALSLVLTPFGGIAVWIWAASAFGLLVYGLRAWALSGVGARGLLDLLWAPAYVVWKLTLRFRSGGQEPKEWIRTTREVKM
jgi:cellulose synthase/poly-beta-1,6-N-acetylglucosamine synthase-like glycosyltransferase